MERFLKVKWENVILVIFFPLNIYAMISHKQTDIVLIFAEIFIYFGMLMGIWFGIRESRLEALYEAKQNQ